MKLGGKKRLVSFGCSFTSGHEIVDHELLNISFEECNSLKKKIGSISKFDEYLEKTTGKCIRSLSDISSKRAYAAKLSEKLNLEYKTYAWHGHALEHSVLLFLQALHKGELNPATDLLFFGLTTPQRYLHFGPDGRDLTRVIHSPFNNIDYFYNSYKIMQTYGFCLQQILATCKEAKFDFILQPVVPVKFMKYNQEEHNYYADMIGCWEFMPLFDKILNESLEYSIDAATHLHDFIDHDIHKTCQYLHPCEEVHDLFAEHLYDKINIQKN